MKGPFKGTFDGAKFAGTWGGRGSGSWNAAGKMTTEAVAKKPEKEAAAAKPLTSTDGLEVASTHGSPWRYDTHVPVIFAGAGLRPATVYRRVHTVDLAPTLSAFLGIQAPAGADGDILVEVTSR